MKPDTEVVHAAHALTSWTSGVSTEIKELSRNVASLLERNLVGKSKVDEPALAGLDKSLTGVPGEEHFRRRRRGLLRPRIG